MSPSCISSWGKLGRGVWLAMIAEGEKAREKFGVKDKLLGKVRTY